MSAKTILSIDSPSLQLAGQIILKFKHLNCLQCTSCSKLTALENCSLVILDEASFKIPEGRFICQSCIAKKLKPKGSYCVLFKTIQSLIETFNLFDIKELSSTITNKTIAIFREKLKEVPEMSRTVLRILKQGLEERNKMLSDLQSNKKCQPHAFLSAVVNYLLKKLRNQEAFEDWFTKKGRLIDLNEGKLIFLIRLMREEISIKLETLKDLYYVGLTHEQPETLLDYCQQAIDMLKNPLQTFLKSDENLKSVLYSIDRREIQLISPFEKEEGEIQPSFELVRTNHPLRSKSAVFQLKCSALRCQYVKLGFFFMSQTSYLAEANYNKAMDPLMAAFLIKVDLNSHQDHQDQSVQILKPVEESHLSLKKRSLLKKDIKQAKLHKKLQLFTDDNDSSVKQDLEIREKNINEENIIEVMDLDLIELQFEVQSSSFVMRNLTQHQEVYRRKFYKRMMQEIRRMVIYPCVLLLSYDCSVELIVDSSP